MNDVDARSFMNKSLTTKPARSMYERSFTNHKAVLFNEPDCEETQSLVSSETDVKNKL